MTDIQQARDVLAKWREDLDGGALSSLLDAAADPNTGYTDYAKPDLGARLIFGTEGNPALWDAIDIVLTWAQKAGPAPVLGRYEVKGIAAAIIAADERMSK